MSIHVIPVAAAVVKKGDRFLLTQRLPNKQYADMWEFPGGKLEGDESVQQALERELREELCMEIRAGAPLYVARSTEYMVIFLEAEMTGETLRCVEAQDARFVSVEEARAMELAPSDRAALEEMVRTGRLG